MNSQIRHLICALSIVVGLSGCTGLRPALTPSQPIEQGHLAKLNGSYWNDTPNNTQRYPYSLLESLLLGKLSRPSSPKQVNLHLTFKAISERAVRIQVYSGQNLLATAIQRGRVRNGCFLMRRRYQVTGFPGFICAFISTRNRLALGTTDTLLLDTARSSFAFMVIMPVGGAEINGYRVPFARR